MPFQTLCEKMRKREVKEKFLDYHHKRNCSLITTRTPLSWEEKRRAIYMTFPHHSTLKYGVGRTNWYEQIQQGKHQWQLFIFNNIRPSPGQRLRTRTPLMYSCKMYCVFKKKIFAYQLLLYNVKHTVATWYFNLTPKLQGNWVDSSFSSVFKVTKHERSDLGRTVDKLPNKASRAEETCSYAMDIPMFA